jgi:hypothetical protein
MWTDRAMRSFICLTMHFVDGDFHQHIWVLEVEGFQGKHDDGLSGFEGFFLDVLVKWTQAREKLSS